MEVKINSLSVIVQFVSSDECKSLLRECPDIIPFILDAYQNARSQIDFTTTKFETLYPADSFLKILRSLCAASDDTCSEVVRRGCLQVVGSALELDPNSFAQGFYLYWQVLFASFIIWHILLAENGRYRENVLKIPEIPKGILYYNILFHLMSFFNANS